jgi:cobalt-zinc-cadmium resistance protein CzcA
VLVALRSDVRARAERLRAAREQVRLYDAELVPLAERAYAIALRLRREGAASYLEVLQAQTALVETRLSALDVRRDALLIQIELQALVAAL